MARYYFGERSPIGRIITFDGQPRPYEIVGVVGEAKYLNLHDPIPRNEIGIRIALGASRRDVMWLEQGRALVLVGAGVALGVPLAFVSERVAVTFVDNLAGGGGVPIGLIAAAMIAVALLAVSIPARRAARVSPLEALRHE